MARLRLRRFSSVCAREPKFRSLALTLSRSLTLFRSLTVGRPATHSLVMVVVVFVVVPVLPVVIRIPGARA